MIPISDPYCLIWPFTLSFNLNLEFSEFENYPFPFSNMLYINKRYYFLIIYHVSGTVLMSYRDYLIISSPQLYEALPFPSPLHIQSLHSSQCTFHILQFQLSSLHWVMSIHIEMWFNISHLQKITSFWFTCSLSSHLFLSSYLQGNFSKEEKKVVCILCTSCCLPFFMKDIPVRFGGFPQRLFLLLPQRSLLPHILCGILLVSITATLAQGSVLRLFF